VELMGIGPMSI